MKKKVTKVTPKKRGNSKKRRPDESWHTRFIEILSQSCNVTLASHGSGIVPKTAYEHRKINFEFAAAWDEAIEQAIDILEAEAWQRARRQSDILIIFLLKAHRPKKYRERVDVKVDKSDEDLVAAVKDRLARVTEGLGGNGTAGSESSSD